MRAKWFLFVKLAIEYFGNVSGSHCDMSTTARVEEGILGQTPDFNWLGIFRVHLHDGDNLQVALSGIVLVKQSHALISADDVARIPRRVFEEDSKAMFIPTADTPWYAKPLSYITHPEYEYATFNTIALIELSFDENEDYPLNPICLPTTTFNTSKHLYLTGYTDETQLLEKVFYRINILEKHVCDEFYNRAGLSAPKHKPTSFICAYSPYNNTQCVWDNGMVLVSNFTGWFFLIGFGIHGPGCAAPARFIDLHPYYPWINSVTGNADVMYDSPDYRRGNIPALSDEEDDIQFVPIHDLFKGNATRRTETDPVYPPAKADYMVYPFDVEKPMHFSIEPYDNDSIVIIPFNNTLEILPKACTSPRTLMYRELFKLAMRDPEMKGVVTYKLTTYDFKHLICSCVQLTVTCENRSEAILSFKESIDLSLGTYLSPSASGETPDELFRFYPAMERTIQPKSIYNSPRFKPAYLDIHDEDYRVGQLVNFDLYIKFEFYGEAKLEFKLLAEPTPSVVMEGPSDFRKSGKETNYTNKKKNKRKKKKIHHGFSNKMIKEHEIIAEAAYQDLQETVSRGHRKQRASALVIFISVCLSRAFL